MFIPESRVIYVKTLENPLTIFTLVLTISGSVETLEIEIQQQEKFGLPSPIFQINVTYNNQKLPISLVATAYWIINAYSEL